MIATTIPDSNASLAVGTRVALCGGDMINAITHGRVVEAFIIPEEDDPFHVSQVIIELEGMRWCVPATCVGSPPKETFESLLPADWLPSPEDADYCLHDGLYFCVLDAPHE